MNIMAAIMAAILLMPGCGEDPGAPLFYTTTGMPVVVRSTNVPLIEDVLAVEAAHLRLVHDRYGRDLRDDYVRAARRDQAIIVFQDLGDHTGLVKHNGNYPAGQFDGRIIRVVYMTGCVGAWALSHELLHLALYLMFEDADGQHDDPGVWYGAGSLADRTRTDPAVARFCTSEFYDVYAQF